MKKNQLRFWKIFSKKKSSKIEIKIKINRKRILYKTYQEIIPQKMLKLKPDFWDLKNQTYFHIYFNL